MPPNEVWKPSGVIALRLLWKPSVSSVVIPPRNQVFVAGVASVVIPPRNQVFVAGVASVVIPPRNQVFVAVVATKCCDSP